MTTASGKTQHTAREIGRKIVAHGKSRNNFYVPCKCAQCKRLRAALKAMERCPGYYTTDQVTGETFDRIAAAATGEAPPCPTE